MDTSTFKPGQLACVQTLDAPLVVSAGAGSGKTFTLTSRIAWALLDGSGKDGKPFLDGIHQVLAITFTKKAAEEIKARVKSTLFAEGLIEQALMVDDSWISTIHGMCSRILRTHALELGIDPAFETISDADAQALLDESIDEALTAQGSAQGASKYDALFREYDARSSGFNGVSVESMVRSLVEKAVSSPAGFDSIQKPPAAQSAALLLAQAQEIILQMQGLASAQKEGAKRDAWLEDSQKFLDALDAAFESGSFQASDLLAFLDLMPWPSGAFGPKEYKAIAKEAQARCAELGREMLFAYVESLVDLLLDLARDVHGLYCQKKHELSVMDQDDLLVFTARAFDENESIRARYADAFKLIMVDEFQDTDQLQIGIIKHMAGPNACRLCTVGDAQQSIYRFRGADVSVYQKHLYSVKETSEQGVIEFPDNFRSHADVLSLVDRVFEQRQVFGSDFMSLAPARQKPKHHFSGSKRVQVLAQSYVRKGANSTEATAYSAYRIAKAFAQYREEGCPQSSMAVLLGRMTNAGVFAKALRSQGFSCVIEGGSQFAQATEVHAMVSVAKVLANPHETAALFEVLASPMFALSADDLLSLSSVYDEACSVWKRRGLDAGLFDCIEQMREGADFSESLQHALHVLRNMESRIGSMAPSRIMTLLVQESGWLSHLEDAGAEGRATAANILKAIRLAEGFEARNGAGPAQVRDAMMAHLDASKEAPGNLTATEKNSVRIMTVHASKGLEFPIVAVAEMDKTSKSGGAFYCETVEGVTYVSIEPSRSLGRFKDASSVKKCKKSDYAAAMKEDLDASVSAIVNAETPAARFFALGAYAAEQETQEKRRLMYVALTRAEEALVISMTGEASASKEPSFAADGINADLRTALFGFDEIPFGTSMVDFKGTQDAIVDRVNVDEECLAQMRADQHISEAQAFAVPVVEDASVPACTPWKPARTDVASYSAFGEECKKRAILQKQCASDEDGEELLDWWDGEAQPAISEDDQFWADLNEKLSEPEVTATDVGSAFHQLAEYAVLDWNRCGRTGALIMPSDRVMKNVVRQYAIPATTLPRLRAALDRWLASSVARDVLAFDSMAPEVPFFEALYTSDENGEAQPLFIEGSIDLLAMDAPDNAAPKRALVVDYKTGGSPDQAKEDVEEKHFLQAAVYAWAVLKQGYDEVNAVFVRVECPVSMQDNSPQCVEYSFTQNDMAQLEEVIRCAAGNTGLS